MRPSPTLLATSLLLLAGCREPADEAPPAPTEEPPQPAAVPLTPRERDRRGDEHLRAGRIEEALLDFDAYLAAEPEAAPYHWRRGIALYQAGEYEAGAAQFVLHRTVNPADVENAAWHYLCVAAARGPEAARAELLPVGADARVPMATVYELFAGRATPDDVLAAAAARPSADAWFFAHLYLGLYHEAEGDPEAARPHLDAAAGEHARPHYMGDVARVHAALRSD